jgi:AraC-like DNA-binding protein/mannose-6-phosphate isomerase-like protein (cupin superfamily)
MQPKNISYRTFQHACQSYTDRADINRPVIVHARDYPAGWQAAVHWHDRSQLVYASAGIMTVETEQGMWVVPPQRAVWIPAGVRHDVHAAGPIAMRSVYIARDVVPWLPPTCCVVHVTPLLRELIGRAAELPCVYARGGQEERIMLLILDEIRALPTAPLHLPEPSDPRLRRITTALKRHPADDRTLEAWGRTVGASSRTLARLFRRETGLSYQQWQRQVRLLSGLIRLAEGQPVTLVAMDVGYESPSAFTAMFKRALGTTPSQYFLRVERLSEP